MLLIELKNIHRNSASQLRLQEIFRFIISFSVSAFIFMQIEYFKLPLLLGYSLILILYTFFFHNLIWTAGAKVRDFTLPSHILARGFFSILIQKLFWLIGIQLFFCIIFLVSLFHFINYFNNI